MLGNGLMFVTVAVSLGVPACNDPLLPPSDKAKSMRTPDSLNNQATDFNQVQWFVSQMWQGRVVKRGRTRVPNVSLSNINFWGGGIN